MALVCLTARIVSASSTLEWLSLSEVQNTITC